MGLARPYCIKSKELSSPCVAERKVDDERARRGFLRTVQYSVLYSTWYLYSNHTAGGRSPAQCSAEPACRRTALSSAWEPRAAPPDDCSPLPIVPFYLIFPPASAQPAVLGSPIDCNKIDHHGRRQRCCAAKTVSLGRCRFRSRSRAADRTSRRNMRRCVQRHCS